MQKMSKYVEEIEVFAEIPDEITLAISISGCPIHCKGISSVDKIIIKNNRK